MPREPQGGRGKGCAGGGPERDRNSRETGREGGREGGREREENQLHPHEGGPLPDPLPPRKAKDPEPH